MVSFFKKYRYLPSPNVAVESVLNSKFCAARKDVPCHLPIKRPGNTCRFARLIILPRTNSAAMAGNAVLVFMLFNLTGAGWQVKSYVDIKLR